MTAHPDTLAGVTESPAFSRRVATGGKACAEVVTLHVAANRGHRRPCTRRGHAKRLQRAGSPWLWALSTHPLRGLASPEACAMLWSPVSFPEDPWERANPLRQHESSGPLLAFARFCFLFVVLFFLLLGRDALTLRDNFFFSL